MLIKIQFDTNLWTLFFLSISSVSTEQWQLYAIEYEGHQDSTVQLEIFDGSNQLFLEKIKAEVPAHDEETQRRSNHFEAIFSTS